MHNAVMILLMLTGANCETCESCDTCDTCSTCGPQHSGLLSHFHQAKGGGDGVGNAWRSCWGPEPQTCYAPRYGCYPGNNRHMHRYPAYHATYYRRGYNYRTLFDYPWHAGMNEPTSLFSYAVKEEVIGTLGETDEALPLEDNSAKRLDKSQRGLRKATKPSPPQHNEPLADAPLPHDDDHPLAIDPPANSKWTFITTLMKQRRESDGSR